VPKTFLPAPVVEILPEVPEEEGDGNQELVEEQ